MINFYRVGKNMKKEIIDKKADDLTEQIYAGFGSGYGVLFGIPSNCRQAVRAVIKWVLKVVDDCPPFSSVRLYKKYRNNRSLCLTEKRYVLEAYWKYTETEKDDALGFKDWLFDYYFKGYGDKKI